jgi:hypothetical protein
MVIRSQADWKQSEGSETRVYNPYSLQEYIYISNLAVWQGYETPRVPKNLYNLVTL